MSNATTFPYEPSWSPVGPHGARVRVRQRGPGVDARLVFTAADGNGYDEEPLGFSLFDAEGKPEEARLKAAKREAAKFSNLRLSGEAEEARAAKSKPLTLGELADLARDNLGSILDRAETEQRERRFRRRLEAAVTFFGRKFVVEEFAPHDLARYHGARRRGEIDCRGRPVPEGKRRAVSKDTASKDLQVLRQVCRFATKHRGPDKQFLLEADPTRDYDLPWNEDPARPIVSDELLGGLREEAPKIRVQIKQGRRDQEPVLAPTSLPALIEVANGTGRRINALVHLRWGDWDREAASYGALTFRGEWDKLGRTTTVPVRPRVREALLELRARRPDILPDAAWVFSSPTEPQKALNPVVALRWLQEVELRVRGQHVKGFGWHAFRRRWANQMRDRPDGHTAALGGWKDPSVMQSVYQRLPEDLDDLDRALNPETVGPKAEEAEAGGG